MKSKFISFFLIFFLVFNFPCFIYAEELNNNSLNKQQEINNQEKGQNSQQQYQQALEQYNQRVQEIEQQNKLINQKYNIPAQKAIEENSKDTASINNTYNIEKAVNQTGEEVPVFIEHIFTGALTQTKDFKIDKNDIITFLSYSSISEKPSNTSSYFYHKTDENHLQGYWILAMASLTSNAKNSSNSWNNGIAYVSSFDEGSTHPNEENLFEMSFTYVWKALQTQPLLDLPELPTSPSTEGAIPLQVKDDDQDDEDEDQDEDDQDDEDEDDQEASIINNNQTNIDNSVENNTENNTENIKKVTNNTKDFINNTYKSFYVTKQNKNKQQTPSIVININHNNKTPSSHFHKKTYWSFINLIILFTSLFITIFSFLFLPSESKETERKEIFKNTISAFISSILLLIFIIFEDTNGIMIYIDKYTLPMFIIFIVQLIEMVVIKSIIKQQSKKSKGRN